MEKQKKGKSARNNSHVSDVRGDIARTRVRKRGYRRPVHMEPVPAPKKRNVGFVFFAIAACAVWPCILMYCITNEPLFMLLVCIAISAMVLSLMFEDSEYTK